MMGKKLVLVVIASLALTAMVAAGAISASSGDDDLERGLRPADMLGGESIVGSWELNG